MVYYLFIYLFSVFWLVAYVQVKKGKVQSPEVQCMAMTNVAQVPKPENNIINLM
jgi:hypothetical protein